MPSHRSLGGSNDWLDHDDHVGSLPIPNPSGRIYASESERSSEWNGHACQAAKVSCALAMSLSQVAAWMRLL